MNRFGLHYVDYKNGCKRYSKSSVAWYADWIQAQTALTQRELEEQKNIAHKHQDDIVLTQM